MDFNILYFCCTPESPRRKELVYLHYSLWQNDSVHIGSEWDWHFLREKLFCPKDDHLQPCLNRHTVARLLGSDLLHQGPARCEKT